MKIPAILFGLFILFSCSEANVSEEPKSYTPEQCIMQAIRDSTITAQDQIIGYQFLCGGNVTIDTFLFFEGNPWREMGFPIIPKKNRYINYSNNYETSIKQGFIPFDLTKSTLQNLQDKFNITKNELKGRFIPVRARTECRYLYSSNDVLLVNYILSIYGVTDTLTLANSQLIHTGSQLKVFLSNGETAYNLISKEYACTGAILDSTHRFLFLRTLKPHPNYGITGIDIRDIQRDSILFQLEMDSSFFVGNPMLYGNYAVYEIFKFKSTNDEEGISLYQVLVFDIGNRKMLKRNFKKDYKCTFEGIANENLIYSYTDHMENDTYESDTFESDTFKIANMEVLSSHTPISQHQ